MSFEEIKRKMHSGEIYDPGEAELFDYQITLIEKVNQYNKTPATKEGLEERAKMLKDMFGAIGEDSYIEPPFHANLGGSNVFIGKYFYANFNLTLVDDGYIYIGDGVMLAPNVTIATATHPISPKLREYQLQYNLPVKIGNNVWIGTGAMIMPGVTIGDNCVIGAGSVVTKDIPNNVVAFGNPCRVIREISEEDFKTYNRGTKIPDEIIEKYK